ncbi:hypothetical protein HELRODRAFT_63054 [Helobdella robusta]|uniref:G-protein coupled receptors family 1 profile domain-containing protein n=1 Tax=Helobdella robusta TaxID=6412 RepID=T1FXA4_HELRO|nr:hypothetical protein HELRODRAFT_63054 [Helobdella robusta]ESO12341.1 hypothetical protein HELRODRAFT_63054 [Helobdella robusta]
MFFFNITSINTTTSHSYHEHNTTRIHNHHFHHRPGFAGFANKHLNGTNVSDEKLPLTFVALPLLFVPVLTVFGNVLVVLSVFTDRNLQSVTNYFIVSLAVADIMVAIFVMPLAVYVEVNNSVWMLGDGLCDVWVALDVLCCTASILNLTAISFDRYFAVTYPIKYARHKNSKRVYIMVGLTWVISVAISSPIVFGANYTERRNQTKHLCTFYNSDFLIYSSMGSFYIPCILMIFLYGRIFNAIRIRAKKAAAQKRVKTTNCRVWSLADTRTNAANVKIIDVSEPPVERKTKGVEMNKSQLVNTEKQSGVLNVNEIDNVGNNVALTPAFEDPVLTSSVNSVQCIYTDPDIKCPKIQGSKALSDQECRNRDKIDLKTIHTFHFRFKKTKAKKNIKNEKKMQSSQRRERKATKTLAIVLGVFLFCWVPFFTINIMNAICIRYDLIGGVCELDPKLFSFFVWLGYMNSFINPVIYTIFNAEFRKAFKKLLKCFSK